MEINNMKFIIWTLVWWGIDELGMWRQYKYWGKKWFDEHSNSVLYHTIFMWTLYLFLYYKFIL